MLALAGLPATAGFIGKLYLIEALVEGDYTWLAVIIAVGTMISLAYYLRVVAAMWMQPGGGASAGRDPGDRRRVARSRSGGSRSRPALVPGRAGHLRRGGHRLLRRHPAAAGRVRQSRGRGPLRVETPDRSPPHHRGDRRGRRRWRLVGGSLAAGRRRGVAQRPDPAALRAAAAGDLLQHRGSRDRRQPRRRAGTGNRRLHAGCAVRLVDRDPLPPPRPAPGRGGGLHRAQRQHRLPRLPAGGGPAGAGGTLDRGPLRRPRHRPLPAARRLRRRRRLRDQGRGNAAASASSPSSPATRRSTRRSPVS